MKPCIRITPHDRTRAPFNVCGGRSTETVSPGAIMSLPDAAISAWVCSRCAARYRKPAHVYAPDASVKPDDEPTPRRSPNRRR